MLENVNARMRPAQPLHLTIGDEFQGGFSSVAHAVGLPVDEPRRLRADVLLTDGDGAPVAEVTGLLAKRGGRK